LTSRLLAHAIYFFRYVDPLLLPPELRPHVRVQSDEYGELPLQIGVHSRRPLSIAYLSSVNEAGCHLLLPFTGGLPLFHPSPPLCYPRSFSCGDHHKLLITSGPDHALVREAGLLVTNVRAFDNIPDALTTDVTAFAGWTADRLTCAESDVSCFQANDAHQAENVRRGKELWPRCALIEATRAALADEWPKAQECLFIAIPRRGLETELTELLLLETLKEETDAGDQHALLLLDHLVEESGAADVSELIESQRNRVEEMQQWQQEQLRLHAEAVTRGELRSSQRKAINAAPSTSASASSRSAAGTSQLTDECTQASSSSASAAAAASTQGANGSSTGLTRASNQLSSVQAASAAELACSWTADAAMTDVAELLQTGRRKFGVIVKAALKFLHSLHPTSVNQSGSHRVFHFGQSGPVTLVIPHAGRRSKDGTVSRRYCTQLYRAMEQATMSQFGPLHSGGASPQVQAQPQMQLPAAESSSASVALTEFD
jgi:predicted nucleic acid-binding protein